MNCNRRNGTSRESPCVFPSLLSMKNFLLLLSLSRIVSRDYQWTLNALRRTSRRGFLRNLVRAGLPGIGAPGRSEGGFARLADRPCKSSTYRFDVTTIDCTHGLAPVNTFHATLSGDDRRSSGFQRRAPR